MTPKKKSRRKKPIRIEVKLPTSASKIEAALTEKLQTIETPMFKKGDEIIIEFDSVDPPNGMKSRK